MTSRDQDVRLRERNDETIFYTVTQPDGTVSPPRYDLTGHDIEVVLKPSPQDVDTDGVVLSTTGGEVTVTDAANGEAQAIVSADATTVPATDWFHRMDVLLNGRRKTACYGTLTIVDL